MSSQAVKLRNVKAGVCVDGAGHGKATHGRFCWQCYAKSCARVGRVPTVAPFAASRCWPRGRATPRAAIAATESLANTVALARERVARAHPRLAVYRVYDYGGPHHNRRRAYDLAVSAEVDRLLAEAGIACEVGLATPTSGNPQARKTNR